MIAARPSSGSAVDLDGLARFESDLDPRHPERSKLPTRVLGYGEISTVLEIEMPGCPRLAYKRMPMFKDDSEARAFAEVYREYVRVLVEQVGLHVVPGELVWIEGRERGRVVAYIVQERIDPAAIGHRLIHTLPSDDIHKLVLAVLSETAKVFAFNAAHRGQIEVGIDGQISNWALSGVQGRTAALSQPLQLAYFDTSTPFLTQGGVEQLDPELFLRSAPSFLTWVLRLLFLKDVMTRYYDLRKVAMDLVANFYKEQMPELVPGLVALVNEFLSTAGRPGSIKPLSEQEVRSYYREDAWIWRLYLAFRKVDRRLHQFVGRHYPYILPDRIAR